jgi:hypothetical protein
MHIGASKLLAIEITSLFLALPFIVWLALYIAARWWSINLRPVLPWLNILRWVGWGLGVALSLIYLGLDRFPAYGGAMITFSIGLSFPQGWVKRRFAPELIEPNSPDGYWPSKRE